MKVILGKWCKQKPNGRGLRNEWKVSGRREESCPTQFDQKGKEREMVGCSLRGRNYLLVDILRET